MSKINRTMKLFKLAIKGCIKDNMLADTMLYHHERVNDEIKELQRALAMANLRERAISNKLNQVIVENETIKEYNNSFNAFLTLANTFAKEMNDERKYWDCIEYYINTSGINEGYLIVEEYQFGDCINGSKFDNIYELRNHIYCIRLEGVENV